MHHINVRRKIQVFKTLLEIKNVGYHMQEIHFHKEIRYLNDTANINEF